MFFLFCVIDIYSKYSLVILLKYEKEILNELNRKANFIIDR